MGYGLVFEELFTSSLFLGEDETPPKRDPGDVRLRVFLVMIGKARDGVYSSSVLGLARESYCRLDQVMAALAELEGPDRYSRSKAEEGRRIIRLDGPEVAWRLVNAEKYRLMAQKDGRRVYMRELMRDRRAEEAGSKGSEAKALLDHWHAEYVRTQGRKPLSVNGAAAIKAAKRYLAAATLDELRAAVTAFMDNPPQFYADKGVLSLESIGKALQRLLKAKSPAAFTGPAVDDPRRRGA